MVHLEMERQRPYRIFTRDTRSLISGSLALCSRSLDQPSPRFVAGAPPAPTHSPSPSMVVTSFAHIPAATTQPTAVTASPLVSVPVNVIDPLYSTGRLLDNRLVRQKVSHRKTKRWTSPIDTPPLARQKRNVTATLATDYGHLSTLHLSYLETTASAFRPVG